MYEDIDSGDNHHRLVGLSGCMIKSMNVSVVSGNRTFPAYLSAPAKDGKKPAVVLIHSFRGLEPGYRNMSDKMAREGFVVLSPEWQTFGQRPSDDFSNGSANQSMPADVIGQLKAPMLMIHGTHDQGKYFELKVYQGQPHGFMIENRELSQSFVARDAYREMVTFFDCTLRE